MATKKPKPQTAKKAQPKKYAAKQPAIPAALVITLIVIAFIATRYWAAAAGLKWISYPHGDQLFSDVTLYDFWGFNIRNGVFPYSSGIPQAQLWTNDAWQYPALAAWIFILGNKINGALIGFIQLAILADLALLGLLVWAGRARRNEYGDISQQANFIPALIWLSAPLFVGPLLVGRFDVFPTLAIVAALLALANARKFGIWIAIGFLLKVWPILGLLAIARTKFKEAFIWFAGVSLVVTAILYFWWSDSLSFLTGQGKRGLQIESVGALPYMMFGQADNAKAIAFRYGAWEVTGAGTKYVSLVMTLVLVALIAVLAWWRWQGRLESIPGTDIALLAVLISMCTSRVLSPQYSIWVVGLLAVAAFKPQPRFWTIAALLLTFTAAGQYLFPGQYSEFQLLHTGGVLIQTVRIACLLTATVLCWLNVIKRLDPKQS
jgi:Glycosyltransferase family 87